MGLKIAQMWDAPTASSWTCRATRCPGLPTQEQILEMRAKGAQPTREGGFGYLRGPDGAMIENAQAGHDRALQPRAHVSRASALRDAVVRHAPRRAHAAGTRRRGRGTRRPAGGDCQTKTVRAADVAVVREDRLRPRSGGRRELRRHLDLDPAVAGRRAASARAARWSITGR